MSILCRDKSLLVPETLKVSIPINSSLTRESQFDQWLNALPPRSCRRHKQTQMELDRLASKRASLSNDNADRWYRRNMTPGPDVPDARVTVDQYAFDAVFRCQACHCAYARCPPAFHETGFGSFDASTPERAAALAKAREFAAQVNKHSCGFALFVGPPGTGKTRLASNVVRELEVRNALYVRHGELTCALRATYGQKDVFLNNSRHREVDEDDNHEPPSPLEIVQDVGFLVLDEIGCTVLASDERLFLNELLKHRYDHSKPTMLISNLPLTGMADSPGLKEFLGDALTDRIREATGNGKFIVQFPGESYRRTTGENYLHGIP
jgi:DNA replication protein DnaC